VSPQASRNSITAPVKTDQLSQTFVTINNTKSSDTDETVIAVVILNTVLFILIQNVFRLLAFNAHGIKIISSNLIFI
jgi:hypothetical protein